MYALIVPEAFLVENFKLLWKGDYRLRRPTLKDVAALAGVSFKTVARVVAKDSSVNETINQRVEAAIAQLGYRPNRLASALRSGQTKSIAMVVLDVTNPFYAETARAAQLVAAESGYQLSLYDTGYKLENEQAILEELAIRAIDGVILAPLGAERKQCLQLHELNIPHVLLDVLPDANPDDVVVSTDHSSGITEAVTFLQGMGHHKIALMVGNSDILSNPHIIQVFQNQMGPYFRFEWVIPCDLRLDGAYSATSHLIMQEDRPTAIISYSDVMALGIYKACLDSGIHVPKDIAVIGYDDIPMAEFLWPPLTTVRQDTDVLGREAVLRLLGLIHKRPITSLLLPPHLMIRQSC